MQFWTLDHLPALALTALLLCVLLVAARRAITSTIPAAVPAGVAAMLLGPAALGWLPLSTAALEFFVYHALGLVFLMVAFSPKTAGTGSRDARRLGVLIPAIGVLQALVGVLTVAVLFVLGAETHLGLGLLLPLGFNQGPGQALSMGRAWEASGLTDGGAMGLVIAALGFAGCVGFGVALLRGRGASGPSEAVAPTAFAPRAFIVRAVVGYALTAAFVFALASLVADKPQLHAMIFGFHFLVALGVGTAMRLLATPTGEGGEAVALRNSASRGTAMVVDFSTTAALAAVSLELLGRHALVLGSMTLMGTLVTLAAAFGLRKRFDESPFEHALLLFGTCTGTLLTGLALLRGVDPQLRSAAPQNMVTAAGGAAICGAPLLLVVMPFAINAWTKDPAWALTSVTAILVGYLLVLAAAGAVLTRKQACVRNP